MSTPIDTRRGALPAREHRWLVRMLVVGLAGLARQRRCWHAGTIFVQGCRHVSTSNPRCPQPQPEPQCKGADLQRVWTLPNLLSASRIVVSPLVGYAVIKGNYHLGALLLAGCAATDAADGWIARKWGQQSALGSLLDPLGDKVLAGVLAVCLACKGLLPPYLAVIVLARDAALVAAGICVRWMTLPAPRTTARFFNPAIATATITPTLVSKANTVLQVALFGATLLLPLFPVLEPDLLRPLHWLVAGSTLWSALSYGTEYRRVVRFIKR